MQHSMVKIPSLIIDKSDGENSPNNIHFILLISYHLQSVFYCSTTLHNIILFIGTHLCCLYI